MHLGIDSSKSAGLGSSSVPWVSLSRRRRRRRTDRWGAQLEAGEGEENEYKIHHQKASSILIFNLLKSCEILRRCCICCITFNLDSAQFGCSLRPPITNHRFFWMTWSKRTLCEWKVQAIIGHLGWCFFVYLVSELRSQVISTLLIWWLSLYSRFFLSLVTWSLVVTATGECLFSFIRHK